MHFFNASLLPPPFPHSLQQTPLWFLTKALVRRFCTDDDDKKKICAGGEESPPAEQSRAEQRREEERRGEERESIVGANRVHMCAVSSVVRATARAAVLV
jgi:hypothetical protein